MGKLCYGGVWVRDGATRAGSSVCVNFNSKLKAQTNYSGMHMEVESSDENYRDV